MPPALTSLTADRAGSTWARRCRRIVLPLLPEIAAIICFVIFIWLAIFVSLGREYQSADHLAVRETSALALAFGDNAKRVVVAVDEMLLAVRAAYTADPEHFDLSAWEKAQRRPDQLRVQIAFIGADGFGGATTVQTAPIRLDLRDRAHFRFHLDPSRDELFISQPVVGRLTQKLTLQFSRKMDRADGSFAGVAVVSLDCDELAKFYGSSGFGGTVLLAGTDGVLRAHSPNASASLVDLHDRPVFAPMLHTREGTLHPVVAVDGLDGVLSFRRLDGYPLIVAVGFDAQHVFATYQATKSRVIVIGLVVSCAVLTLGMFWIAQRHRSARSRRALDLTLESMGQGIVMIDADGRVGVANRRAVDLLNLPFPDSLRDLEPIAHQLAATSGAEAKPDNVLSLGGRLIEVSAHAIAEGGSVITCTDVTARHRDEERIRHLALHDGLTGLANRAALAERIAAATAEARSRDTHVGVITIDLDGFKLINDALGHDVGDRLLTSVARLLRQAVRASDTVARVGGDEFTVVMRNLPRAEIVEQTAEYLVALLGAPIELLGHHCAVGASIGVAVFPEDGDSDKSVLANSDIALYAAKESGGGRFRRFERSMYDAIERRRWLEDELRIGLGRGDIEVHFQPQFSPHTLALTGFEALARWRHPVRGYIPPNVFIPVAEEHGLILDLGQKVLEIACARAAEWRHSCRVAVNLSPAQFRSSDLPEMVAATLANSGLAPERLELEITEGVLISDERQALRLLEALRDLGVKLALDDFGIGYSSLSYLHRFPFDRVKIDRSFVQAQEHDPRARAILNAVVGMSGNLGLAVTAEGIETEDQLAMVRQQGITEVQGFYLARPLTAAAAALFLADSVSSRLRPDHRAAQARDARRGEPAEA